MESIPAGIDPNSTDSTSKIINRIEGGFTIELLRSLGSKDVKPLMHISQSLVESFGLKLLATRKDILNYFNPPSTHPFIARFHGEPESACAAKIVSSIFEGSFRFKP